MPPTLGFQPFVHSSETEVLPFARPLLDSLHSFLVDPDLCGTGTPAGASPTVQPPSSQVAPVSPDREEQPARDGLSRCRLRIFHNGNLGRAHDWAVLISELLPQTPALRGRFTNPGIPARHHLDALATGIKRTHLLRTPAEQIAWFYHQTAITSIDRPRPHDLLDRVDFCIWDKGLAKDIYFGFSLEPCSPEDLELAAGGLVNL